MYLYYYAFNESLFTCIFIAIEATTVHDYVLVRRLFIRSHDIFSARIYLFQNNYYYYCNSGYDDR